MKIKIKILQVAQPLILAAIGCLASSPVLAAEVSADFRAGFSTSDNVERTSGGDRDDQTIYAGTSLSYLDQSLRSIIDIRANMDYVEYVDDSFESELVGGFDGRVRFFLVPERVSWIIRDNFGQRVIDPLARPNPGNREDINYFSTGPTFRMPVGNRNFARLAGQYSIVTFEESSAFDSDRILLQAQFGREIRSDTTLSLNVENEETKFDNAGMSSDFEVLDSFLRYAVLSTRNDITIDVGFTRLESDDGQAGDGVLLRADWTRFISPTTSFAAGAGSRYSDQGDIFEFTRDIATDVGDTVDSDGTDVPFRSNYVFLRYSKNTPRTQMIFEARMTQDDYEFGLGRDRDLLFGNFSLTRNFTASTFGTLAVRASKRDYRYLNQVDDQIDLTATIGFRLSRYIDMRLSYVRADRDSNVAFQDFTENRAVVQFTYTPPWGDRTEGAAE